MKFWDSSAVVALLLTEPRSRDVEGVLHNDGDVIVWWWTPVECLSAMARSERGHSASSEDIQRGRRILEILGTAWHEVTTSEEVRERAGTLLLRHPLRAGDALQLGAALTWADGRSPPSRHRRVR